MTMPVKRDVELSLSSAAKFISRRPVGLALSPTSYNSVSGCSRHTRS